MTVPYLDKHMKFDHEFYYCDLCENNLKVNGINLLQLLFATVLICSALFSFSLMSGNTTVEKTWLSIEGNCRRFLYGFFSMYRT